MESYNLKDDELNLQKNDKLIKQLAKDEIVLLSKIVTKINKNK